MDSVSECMEHWKGYGSKSEWLEKAIQRHRKQKVLCLPKPSVKLGDPTPFLFQPQKEKAPDYAASFSGMLNPINLPILNP